jgi:HSP20 family protein
MKSLITRGNLFDDLFREISPGFFIKPLHGDELPTASKIKVDVKENGDEYSVRAEVPGVNKEDIQVSIEGNVVTLRAEIQQEDKKTEDEKVLRCERYYGAVSRSFQLPSEIDETKARAKYENGILVLTLPKKASNASQKLIVE